MKPAFVHSAPTEWSEDTDGSSSDQSFHTPPASLGDVFASSPAPPNVPSPDVSPVRDVDDLRFRLAADLPPARRVAYSSEEDLSLPEEPTATCLGRWRPALLDVDKYVDDNLQEERISMENAPRLLTTHSEERMKHTIGTQNVFRHVIRAAEKKGMKLNAKKTNMLCISDSLNFKARCYIEDRDGVRIESTEKMKMLGWHFSSRPTVAAYIDVLKRRFRERYWTLRHLKLNGFTEPDLVKMYTSIVRPVADYMMEVYHSMLTDRQDEEIERLRTHALRCIYGPRISGRKLREMADLPTLRERRIEACDKLCRQ